MLILILITDYNFFKLLLYKDLTLLVVDKSINVHVNRN